MNRGSDEKLLPTLVVKDRKSPSSFYGSLPVRVITSQIKWLRNARLMTQFCREQRHRPGNRDDGIDLFPGTT